MRIESFKRAESKISFFISKHPYHGFSIVNLRDIFISKSEEWNIAAYRTIYDFINFLLEEDILVELKLSKEKKIYIKPGYSNFNISKAIKKNSYLAYFSAVSIHGLTLQIPKVIYSCVDRIYHRISTSELKQENIDKAFSKPQRVSNNFYIYNSFKFYFFEKKIEHTEVGVIHDAENDIKYTDLERTLIDIAIKPMYAGGVFEVLEAFKSAKERLDVSKMKDYLSQLNYIYPYDQVIGFYLECAEYNINQINVFYKKEKQLSFYLTHNIVNKEFSEKWKIYYPLGFKPFNISIKKSK